MKVSKSFLTLTLAASLMSAPVLFAQTILIETGQGGQNAALVEQIGDSWAEAQEASSVEGLTADRSPLMITAEDGESLDGSLEIKLPDIKQGPYNVELTWPRTANASNVSIFMTTESGPVASLKFNMDPTNADQWILIGSGEFPAAQQATLTIDAKTVSGKPFADSPMKVVVDAVRLTPVDSTSAARSSAIDSPEVAATPAPDTEDEIESPFATSENEVDSPFASAEEGLAEDEGFVDSPFEDSNESVEVSSPFAAEETTVSSPFEELPQDASDVSSPFESLAEASDDEAIDSPFAGTGPSDPVVPSSPFSSTNESSTPSSPFSGSNETVETAEAADSPFSNSDESGTASNPFASAADATSGGSTEVSSPFSSSSAAESATPSSPFSSSSTAESTPSSPFSGSTSSATMDEPETSQQVAMAETPTSPFSSSSSSANQSATSPFSTSGTSSPAPSSPSSTMGQSSSPSFAAMEEIEDNTNLVDLTFYNSIDEALAKSKVSGKPIIVLFSGKSTRAERFETLMSQPNVADELSGFELVRVNYRDNRPLARKYAIRSFPYVVILNKFGYSVGHVLPSVDEEELLNELSPFTQQFYE